jgi:hypothetical protein
LFWILSASHDAAMGRYRPAALRMRRTTGQGFLRRIILSCQYYTADNL